MTLAWHRCLFMVLALKCVAACSSLPIDVVRLGPSTLSQNLVAHLRFDEGTGSVVADTSGNRRDGTLTGGEWLSDGQFGGALRLGDGEFVAVSQFPDATSNYSVSAWVRISSYSQDTSDTGQWGTVISTEVGNTGGWELNIDHRQASPVLNFAFWKGPNTGDFDYVDCDCLPLGRWTHVVAIVESTTATLTMYVDGNLSATSNFARGILPGSSELHMGTWAEQGRYLLGDLDDIAIWNRALVSDEMVFAASAAVPDPN
jgi:hypothetical protein